MSQAKRTRRLVQLVVLTGCLVGLTRSSTAASASACSLCTGYSLCMTWNEGTDGCYVGSAGVCDQQGSSCGI